MDQLGILTSYLADLLGFADGASDVLEHLLSIESRADLLDYLVQLLGADRQDQLVTFVDHVERYQRGELIPLESQDNIPPAANMTHAKKPALVTLTTKKQTTPPPALHTPSHVKAPKIVPPPTDKSINVISPPVVTTTTADPTLVRHSNRNKKKVAVVQQQQQQQQQKAVPVRKPSQGKASIECGCFGRLHPALTNCLQCGRISCAREGYDYCPFCGFLVEEIDKSTALHDEAWLHKERLLQYDREVVQRTVVIDDQADYYSNANSVWLTDQERAEETQQEKQRHDEMQFRQKMQLNLSIP